MSGSAALRVFVPLRADWEGFLPLESDPGAVWKQTPKDFYVNRLDAVAAGKRLWLCGASAIVQLQVSTTAPCTFTVVQTAPP